MKFEADRRRPADETQAQSYDERKRLRKTEVAMNEAGFLQLLALAARAQHEQRGMSGTARLHDGAADNSNIDSDVDIARRAAAAAQRICGLHPLDTRPADWLMTAPKTHRPRDT
jgi:hypothetical protein